MNTTQSSACEYSGIENLEAMKHAQHYNRFLIDLVRRHVDGRRILDFGAGAGTFAQPMRDAGHEVVCIEPDRALHRQLADDGFESLVDIDAVPAGSVDSIYSLNVLEHIADDRDAIARLAACLRRPGRLVLYVPAFQLLYSTMDRRVGHHRRYRRPQLVELLENAGLQIEKARYVDSLGFFAALAYRFAGNDSGIISPGPVRLYDRWVFPLSRALDRVTLGSFGKNLFVVAVRP